MASAGALPSGAIAAPMKSPLLSFSNPRLPSLSLLCAWFFGAVGLLIGLTIDPVWFGRFGSLIVLFAVIGEFSMLKGELYRLYQRLGSSPDGLVHSKDFTPSRWQEKKSVLLHLTVVIGTVIWGFGDLLL